MQETESLIYNNSLEENSNLKEIEENNDNNFNYSANETYSNCQTFTIDEAITKMGTGPFQYKLLILAGSIYAAEAMELMLISFLVKELKDSWNLKSPWDGSIAAVVFLGMFIGSGFWSILSDRIGRRRVIIISNFTVAIAGTLSAIAPNIYIMLIFRFFVGICVAASAVSFTLFSEYSVKHNRGFMLICEQSFWGIGTVYSVLMAWLTLSILNWRYYLLVTAIPVWIIALFYKYIPESSRYLITCNKTEEAMKLLKRVSSDNGVDLPEGTLKFDKLLDAEESRGNISDIFDKSIRYGSVLLYIIFFTTVFVSFGLVFISERFFDKISNSNTYWEMLVASFADLPALIIGALVLDKIGRKRTMIICFMIYSSVSFMLTIPVITNVTGIGLVLVFFGRLGASLGFATVYIYFSEYYPTSIRATSLGLASALGRLAGIATSYVSEDLSINLAMVIYTICGIVISICCILLPYDTLGKDLKDKIIKNKQSKHVKLKDEE